ncbi:hypothetical protein K492DRAFT_210197 [Lichtheimia hyalospora FSU 10163]|nr:hypothetical protein K492DRAFT_210197 [Lichtheimia hyalospora FSU 10163]
MAPIAENEVFNEQKSIDTLDDLTLQILRKYRKRMDSSGYQSLPDLWQDFAPVMDAAVKLPPPQAMQRMLSLTSYFYEFCHGYRADTEKYEYEEYFDAMNNAWEAIFQQQHGMTDRIRALNVLRDGHTLAQEEFELPHALNGALEAALKTE